MSTTKLCFVAMPFEPELNTVWEELIEPSCKKIEIYKVLPWRADNEAFFEKMIPQMMEKMTQCDLFIADLTGYNLNVMYEVGYLHSQKKNGAFITQDRGRIPHYLSDYPILEYGSGLNSLNGAREKLTAKLIRLMNQPKV